MQNNGASSLETSETLEGSVLYLPDSLKWELSIHAWLYMAFVITK